MGKKQSDIVEKDVFLHSVCKPCVGVLSFQDYGTDLKLRNFPLELLSFALIFMLVLQNLFSSNSIVFYIWVWELAPP